MKMSKEYLEKCLMERRDTLSLQERVRWIEGYLEYFRIEDIKRKNEKENTKKKLNKKIKY